MSAKLVVKHSFGINQNIKNCLTFVEDHNLLYPVGHQLAILNTESKEQSFLSIANQGVNQSYTSYGITAVAVSLTRKFIAVAEKSEPHAVVSLYDSHSLRKKKTLSHPDLGSKEVRCINFSDDGRFCITQGCSPEWNLVMWNVEKSAKIIHSAKSSNSDDTPIHQISFNPLDSNSILVTGKTILKLFKLADGQLRQITLSVRRDTGNFLCHSWLADDFLVVGSEAGEIFLLENYEYRAVLFSTALNLLDEPKPIYSLACTSRGFMAGCHGEVLVFERAADTKEHYVLIDTLVVDDEHKGKMIAMAVSNDDMLVIGTDSQQLLQLPISNVYRGDKDKPVKVEPLVSSFHRMAPKGDTFEGSSGIIAIDTALWRQIIVTAGRDRTVRVWSIQEGKQEVMAHFDEEITYISMHPTGLYVAVAFLDIIKVMSIHHKKLKLFKEFNVRNCTYIKFSHGGHILAASNGSLVQLYDLYSGAVLNTLRGHTNKVKSITWTHFDSRMITVGAEGTVFTWNLFPLLKRPEGYVGIIPFRNGSACTDGSKALIATSERTLKEVSFTKSFDPISGLEGEVNPPRDIEINYQVSVILFDDHRRLLLVGTCDENRPGSIVSYMTSPCLSNNCDISLIHSSAVTALCLSYDGSHVYSGDSNGCIIISQFDGAQKAKSRDGSASFEFMDEIVLEKKELDAKKATIHDLNQKIEELTLNNDHQLRLKEMDHNAKVNDITIKFTSHLKTESEKFETEFKEKSEMESKFSKEMEDLGKKQQNEILAIENKYRLKINAESNRHKNLMEETEEMHKRWNDENRALVESHQRYLQELSDDYDEKLRSEQTTQRKVQLEKEEMKIQSSSVLTVLDDDADSEIEVMKSKYIERLKREEEAGQELVLIHGRMKKSLQLLNKDAELQKEDMKKLKDKQNRLLENKKTLEKDIQAHKKEIKEREDTITDKERRIFDLKKKNQELEKFRFVLDYKIKELKLQIVPRETEIVTMKKQIEEMDLELEQYHRSNAALKLMITELKLKLDSLGKEHKCQDEKFIFSQKYIDKYKRELKDVYDSINDSRHLKTKIVKMYRSYVQESDKGSGSIKGLDSQDPQQVYNRDREQMEKSLEALRRALKTDVTALRRDTAKMMRENTYLINELNTLKKDYNSLRLQRKSVDESGGISRHNLPFLIEVLGIPQKRPRTPPKSAKSGKVDATSLDTESIDMQPKPIGMKKKSMSTSGRFRTRTTAMKTIDAEGNDAEVQLSKQDKYAMIRELEMQSGTILKLEEELRALCYSLNFDYIDIYRVEVESKLN